MHPSQAWILPFCDFLFYISCVKMVIGRIMEVEIKISSFSYWQLCLFGGSLWCFQPSSSLQALWRYEKPSLNCSVYGAIAFPSQTIAELIVLRKKKKKRSESACDVYVTFNTSLNVFLGLILDTLPFVHSICPSHEWSIYLYHSDCR